ncbi:hypothetical protein P4O66_015985 [Electrophorus voltai]|uniref:FIIND domain-containing protein n=1 Tax=Electrophorus voltai TaxID=2609070 RepID=A0AAD8YWP0_9TELE|nr:hypothetical protein P4O66_015985 [Electrophorus voltai]
MKEIHLEGMPTSTYSFLCPHAGQFQCKITNIVFEMEGKGEVLYRIVSWDTRLLDGLGHMQPAGPLYEIDCCEEENQMELTVANFINKVKKKHKGSTYFETSSRCQADSCRKYKVSCDPYVPQPKHAVFDCHYGPNHHPTFVVFSEAEDITVSVLDEDGMEVWEPHQVF